MSTKAGTTREAQELTFNIYYQADLWVARPRPAAYRVQVLGTPMGKGGTGTKWHVDGIRIDPPLPRHSRVIKPNQWTMISPLLARGITQATDREPVGLLAQKVG